MSQSSWEVSKSSLIYDDFSSRLSIVRSDWALKKLGQDSFYKKRWLWIDTSDQSFHWCKVQDRSIPHKRIQIHHLTSVRIGHPSYSSYFESKSDPELCWSMELSNGVIIDIQASHFMSLFLIMIYQMNDQSKVRDWVRVFQAMIKPKETSSSFNEKVMEREEITDNQYILY